MLLLNQFGRMRSILISFTLCLTLSTCGANNDVTNKLQLTGSSTMAPLLTELAKAYEKLHPDTRIDVQTGGSSRGILDTREGLIDIGMVSRALKEQEQDLHAHTIARDGIAIILHKNNPVTSLDNNQIIDIYKGTIQNWNKLGGNESAITVVSKAEGRSTLELFLKYFKLQSSEIKAHSIIGDNEQGIKTVAGNPNAIGYVSIGAAQYSIDNGIPIKLISINGITASIETVSNGQFPLSRPLNLVTLTQPEGAVAAFLDYAQSKQADELIKQQYFVPLQH